MKKFAAVIMLSLFMLVGVGSVGTAASNDDLQYIIDEVYDVVEYLPVGEDYSLPSTVIGHGYTYNESNTETLGLPDSVRLGVEWETDELTNLQTGEHIINGVVSSQEVGGIYYEVADKQVAARILVGEAADKSGAKLSYSYADYLWADSNTCILPLVSEDGQIRIDSDHRPYISYNGGDRSTDQLNGREPLLHISTAFNDRALKITLPKATRRATLSVTAFSEATAANRKIDIVDGEGNSLCGGAQTLPAKEAGEDLVVDGTGIHGVETLTVRAELTSGGDYYINCEKVLNICNIDIEIIDGDGVAEDKDHVTTYSSGELPTEQFIASAPDGFVFYGWVDGEYKPAEGVVPAGRYTAVYAKLTFFRPEAVPTGDTCKIRFVFHVNFYNEEYVAAVLDYDNPIITLMGQLVTGSAGKTTNIALSNYVIEGKFVHTVIALTGVTKTQLNTMIHPFAYAEFNGNRVDEATNDFNGNSRQIIEGVLENNYQGLSEEALEFLREFIA